MSDKNKKKTVEPPSKWLSICKVCGRFHNAKNCEDAGYRAWAKEDLPELLAAERAKWEPKKKP